MQENGIKLILFTKEMEYLTEERKLTKGVGTFHFKSKHKQSEDLPAVINTNKIVRSTKGNPLGEIIFMNGHLSPLIRDN